MANILIIPTFKDERGSLTVIEKVLPFEVKRIFYIYDVSSRRGGHGHIKTKIALVALNGSVDIYVQTPTQDETFKLSKPDEVLILDPEDWHEMYNFSKGSILLALCSLHYDKEDYFFEPYRK